MPRLKLQDRILLVILAVILPFATLTFFSVDRKLSTEAEDKLTTELEVARASFDEVRHLGLDELTQTARLVAELPYFKAAVSVYDPNAPRDLQVEQINTIVPVARVIMDNVNLDFFALTDTSGAVILARGRHAPIPTEWLGHSFAGLRQVTAIGGHGVGSLEVSGRLYQVVMVPMVIAGEPAGVLAVGRLYDDAMAARIQRMSQSEVIIFSRGDPIARSSGAADGAREEALAGMMGRVGFVSPSTIQPVPMTLAGRRYLTLWTPIWDPQGQPIGQYVLMRSLDQALAYLRSVRQILTGVWVAALLAAVLLSIVMARQLTRPIQRLVKATERIAAGDFSHMIRERRQDELGTLARTFDQMNAGLRDSHEQLAESNRILRERTLELEQSHARLLESTRELERSNQELRETQAQLIQASKMAAFGELGAGLAHELNNPLTSVKGFAQLILGRVEPDSPHRRGLELIVKSVDHMARIVTGLKNFARQTKFEFQPVTVNEVIEETCLFLGAQLHRHRVQLDLDLDERIPAVLGDRNQIQQVLTNLIGNARDALEGHPTARVRLRSRARFVRRYVVVSVADNGPGVPAEIRESIFRSFFTTKPAGKGTGLGLSISRAIVEDHGGRLSVTSREGEGAVFRIVLPAAGTASAARDETARAA